MHVNDIKAFAGKVVGREVFGGKQVIIRGKHPVTGKVVYLSRNGGFDATVKADARVFDYDLDGVGEQVEVCNRAGMPIEAEMA